MVKRAIQIDAYFTLLSLHRPKLLSKDNYGSAGPIFTKCLQYGRYLIVDCRFDPFSDVSRDVAMATNFSVKIGTIGQLILIRRLLLPNFHRIVGI